MTGSPARFTFSFWVRLSRWKNLMCWHANQGHAWMVVVFWGSKLGLVRHLWELQLVYLNRQGGVESALEHQRIVKGGILLLVLLHTTTTITITYYCYHYWLRFPPETGFNEAIDGESSNMACSNTASKQRHQNSSSRCTKKMTWYPKCVPSPWFLAGNYASGWLSSWGSFADRNARETLWVVMGVASRSFKVDSVVNAFWLIPGGYEISVHRSLSENCDDVWSNMPHHFRHLKEMNTLW